MCTDTRDSLPCSRYSFLVVNFVDIELILFVSTVYVNQNCYCFSRWPLVTSESIIYLTLVITIKCKIVFIIIIFTLQALNGFLLVLSPIGEFVFISNSIEELLGLKRVCNCCRYYVHNTPFGVYLRPDFELFILGYWVSLFRNGSHNFGDLLYIVSPF